MSGPLPLAERHSDEALATTSSPRYAMLTDATGTSSGMQLREGLNVALPPRDPALPNAHRGIVVAEMHKIAKRVWTCGKQGVALLWDAEVPEGTPLLPYGHDTDCRVVDRVVLRNPRPVPDDVLDAAVRAWWRNLQYLPEDKRTAARCEQALCQHPSALQFVPRSACTEPMCLETVQRSGSALKHVPDERRTVRVCRAAVAQHGLALSAVPTARRTEALCLEAVRQDGFAVSYVPRAACTRQVLLAAIAQNRHAVHNIPEGMCTEEIALAAIPPYDAYPILSSIPSYVRTEAVCRAAVERCGGDLEYVPEHLRTESLCRVAAAQSIRAYRHIPYDAWSLDLCLQAMDVDVALLKHAPPSLRAQALRCAS